jgi:SAM-dependent methyltransferase
MISNKTPKELAYLQDLFIAPDWGERFASLIDTNIELPKEAEAVYLACGTGGHALALKQRAGDKFKLIAIDENPENVEIARAKARGAGIEITLEQGHLEKLNLKENQFDLVMGNGSLVPVSRQSAMLKEMVRLAKPKGKVALGLPSASSFGEFFSIYWEALHNCGLIAQESDVENLITELPTISDLEQLADRVGLEQVQVTPSIEEFDFESGEEFLRAPLIADFLMVGWLAPVPEEKREQVTAEITSIINEERHEGIFSLTVKATIIVGVKARTN